VGGVAGVPRCRLRAPDDGRRAHDLHEAHGAGDAPGGTGARGVVHRRPPGRKSRVASLLAVFVAAFRDYAGCLAPGKKATVAVIAADRQQARGVFRYICGLLDAVPMLRALVERQTVDTYGRWLKMRDTAAADRLDTLPVSEPVSAGTSS